MKIYLIICIVAACLILSAKSGQTSEFLIDWNKFFGSGEINSLFDCVKAAPTEAIEFPKQNSQPTQITREPAKRELEKMQEKLRALAAQPYDSIPMSLQEDMQTLICLMDEFSDEIASLGVNVDSLKRDIRNATDTKPVSLPFYN